MTCSPQRAHRAKKTTRDHWDHLEVVKEPERQKTQLCSRRYPYVKNKVQSKMKVYFLVRTEVKSWSSLVKAAWLSWSTPLLPKVDRRGSDPGPGSFSLCFQPPTKASTSHPEYSWRTPFFPLWGSLRGKTMFPECMSSSSDLHLLKVRTKEVKPVVDNF